MGEITNLTLFPSPPLSLPFGFRRSAQRTALYLHLACLYGVPSYTLLSQFQLCVRACGAPFLRKEEVPHPWWRVSDRYPEIKTKHGTEQAKTTSRKKEGQEIVYIPLWNCNVPVKRTIEM